MSEVDANSAALPQLVPERMPAVTDLAAKAIREAILAGRFRAGQRLVQADVAQMLGVSRQPVREAFRHLESEGLVVPDARGGVVVREYTAGEIAENYHLRTVLEAEAAALAAQEATYSDFEELSNLNDDIRAAVSRSDLDTVVAANFEFHERIRQSCNLALLKQLIDMLWVGYSVITPLFVPGRAARSVIEHDKVITALRQRDSQEAGSAMRQHIQAGFADYQNQSRR